MMLWRYGEIRPLAKRADGSGSITTDGYLAVFRPGHSEANSQGRALEHRVVMSDLLGRPLAGDEYIHHRNGNRLDNAILNLELWVKAQPSGQRVTDLLAYANAMISRYGAELEKLTPSEACRYEDIDLGDGYVTFDGYFAVKRHSHSNARSDGYILAHRFVMSEVLRRPLMKHERVHHKNGDKLNNRPDNLELWLISQPPGQRPSDVVAWCRFLLDQYRGRDSFLETG